MIFHVKFSNQCYITLFLPVFFLSNPGVVECLFTISTSRVIVIICASYLDSHWYATVKTAIIYLYHGLLSVRYVALYDRIERQWHVFVQKCKRFIGENINKHFPWKMPGRCIYITAYCQSIMLPYTTELKGSDMYLFRNVNGLLEKTPISTFSGKCQDDVQALRFSKAMYRVRLREIVYIPVKIFYFVALITSIFYFAASMS